AVAMAAQQIVQEHVEVALAGGVESITMTAERPQDPNPWVVEHRPELYMLMGNTAEVVAQRYQIGRLVQDEYALQSQLRTAHAQRAGYFAEELAPMRVRRGRLNPQTKKID